MSIHEYVIQLNLLTRRSCGRQ